MLFINSIRKIRGGDTMTIFNCNGECESCRLAKHYRESGDDYYTCDNEKTRGIRVRTPMDRKISRECVAM